MSSKKLGLGAVAAAGVALACNNGPQSQGTQGLGGTTAFAGGTGSDVGTGTSGQTAGNAPSDAGGGSGGESAASVHDLAGRVKSVSGTALTLQDGTEEVGITSETLFTGANGQTLSRGQIRPGEEVRAAIAPKGNLHQELNTTPER